MSACVSISSDATYTPRASSLACLLACCMQDIYGRRTFAQNFELTRPKATQIPCRKSSTFHRFFLKKYTMNEYNGARMHSLKRDLL